MVAALDMAGDGGVKIGLKRGKSQELEHKKKKW